MEQKNRQNLRKDLIHYKTWMERVENNFCNIKKLWYNNYEREMKEL